MTSKNSVPCSAPVYVALDFETADYKPDSACALGMTKVFQGQIVDHFYSCIRPPRQKVYFTHIHGLTWKTLKDSPTFFELWPQIEDFLRDATHLVAHNAPFDKRILAGCCTAFALPMPALPFVCTLRESRRILKLPSHTLDAVCRHCGISFQHHHAGEDATAAAQVLLYLQEKAAHEARANPE